MSDEKQSDDLLPCPFCGKSEIVHENVDGRHSIGCKTEDCFGYQSLATHPRRADAVKAWNTRSGTPGDSEILNWIAAHVTEFEFYYRNALLHREVKNSANTGKVFRNVVVAAMKSTTPKDQ